jgi:hypothetical protein
MHYTSQVQRIYSCRPQFTNMGLEKIRLKYDVQQKLDLWTCPIFKIKQHIQEGFTT